MTFAEKLTHVAKDDPKFAKSVKRMRIASWVFGLGVALAIGIGIWSLAVNVRQDNQITKIESPCLKYGSKSPQCKKAFEAAVATITHPEACAIERKAGTLQAVRQLAAELDVSFTEPCAGARIAQERKRGNEREAAKRRPGTSNSGSVRTAELGGDGGLSPAANAQPAPPKPPGPRHQPSSAPPTSGSGDATSPAPGIRAPAGPAEAPAAPNLPEQAQGTLPGTVEATGKAGGEVVDKAGGAVDGTVEGLGSAGCKLTGSC